MKNQIELLELIFTQSWEDPLSDHKAVDIKPDKEIFAITSGGCNILNFLRHDPRKIYAVDINPVQRNVLDLKMTAMRHLDHSDYLGFLGLKENSNRMDMYNSIYSDMHPESRLFWDRHKEVINNGFLGKGKFEQYTRKSGRMLRMLQGKKLVKELFMDKEQKEQEKFFDDKWDTWRLRKAFNYLYSKRKLAKRGLKDDYFHFDDGSKSFAENFYNRHRNVIRNIPIGDNYFLASYILGKYRSLNDVPDYLNAAYYDQIKSRLDRVENVAEDAKTWLAKRKESSIDGFVMSNICELMSDADTKLTFESMYHAGREGAKVCFRNLMVPRDVPDSMMNSIVVDAEVSKRLIIEDRSFVYSKVNQYSISK